MDGTNEGGLLGGAAATTETTGQNNAGAGDVAPGTTTTGTTGETGETNTPPEGGSGIVIPENWKDAIPEDLRGDPSLKPINDFEGLIKSYVHAQKQMGMDKITIPGEHASTEEWDQLYNKLGLPEDVEKYDIKPADSGKMDEDFFNKFKEQALAAKIMPGQAQKLHDWFNEFAAQENENSRIENQAFIDKEVGVLKSEWGDAFVPNVKRANAVMEEFGGTELAEHLAEVGLNNDVKLIKMFNNIGQQLYKEGKFSDGKGEYSGVSPDDSEQKIRDVMGDAKHPYHVKGHPSHKAAVQEMTKHYQNIRNAKTPKHQAVG